MFGRRSHRLILLGLIFVIGACNGPDHIPPDQQLIEIREQLSEMSTRHQALAQRCSRISEQLALLKLAHENLEIKAAELSHWSQQLAESFGPGIWYFSNAERPLPFKAIPAATPDLIISELNRLFVRDNLPAISLEKIEDKIAYVQISDEQQLTQHMGTTGATAFIEVVTYSLTSLKSIDFVEFSFKEGDHAIPGRYSR
jgi:hypothetical protein